jgi:NAD(P)-dependent dehydrogenase (short-subunit alcohol dehydrogenase family)
MPDLFAVTGAASGIGAAVREWLLDHGNEVIGVDLHGSDVDVDLGTPEGRVGAIGAIRAAGGGRLSGLVPCAGLAGLPGRPASLLVSVNYFGAIELISGLRDELVAGNGAVVAISSNSTTIQPRYSMELVDALLTGNEGVAREVADRGDSLTAYPATKTAIARWIRRNGPQPDWAGAGVRLNAVAPGMVETPLVAEGRADDQVAPLLATYPMPLGRAGAVEEIADAIGFLLSNPYCVGTVMLIDGGTEALLRPDDWPAVWPI